MIKDSQCFQRSKAKQFKEGDVNYGVFEICQEVVNFFSSQFKKLLVYRSQLDGVSFLSLSKESSTFLTSYILHFEIDMAVAFCDGE